MHIPSSRPDPLMRHTNGTREYGTLERSSCLHDWWQSIAGRIEDPEAEEVKDLCV
jgi:hypothetical protein